MHLISSRRVSMNANGRELLGQPAGGHSGRKGRNCLLRCGVFVSFDFRFFFSVMKTSWVIIVLMGLLAATVSAQDTPRTVTERGPHHRVWEWTTRETTSGGRVVARPHQVVELATGLNFWDSTLGQWADSREEVTILPDGTARAVQGQHQVIFPGNIYEGAISLTGPGGEQLKSRPVGLAYDDGANTVMIALLAHSPGELVSSNQVMYPNAFEGADGAVAGLRYTYTKSGFAQDVLIQRRLPPPQSFGLNAERTKLAVLTEFFDTDNPMETPGPVSAQDGLRDRLLTFGTMTMRQGRAFAIGESGWGDSRAGGAPTYKSWLKLEGRTFLVEEVPYLRVQSQLDQLPALASANVAGPPSTNMILDKVSARRLLPPFRAAQTGTNRVQLARGNAGHQPALVLDYEIFNPGASNAVFRGDLTYYISDKYSLSG